MHSTIKQKLHSKKSACIWEKSPIKSPQLPSIWAQETLWIFISSVEPGFVLLRGRTLRWMFLSFTQITKEVHRSPKFSSFVSVECFSQTSHISQRAKQHITVIVMFVILLLTFKGSSTISADIAKSVIKWSVGLQITVLLKQCWKELEVLP